jgi:hypothetical protein
MMFDADGNWVESTAVRFDKEFGIVYMKKEA